MWGDLQSEPDAAETPTTEDAVSRAWLDAWLAGVLSSDGRPTKAGLDDLLDIERATRDHAVARGYVDRVIATVMPSRDEEPARHADLADAIRRHCRERGYQVSNDLLDRFRCRSWKIEVPNREGSVICR